jgi:NAD(P)-dependent dehydrogenase (short-subunit alcohol dehydrogenase family)
VLITGGRYLTIRQVPCALNSSLKSSSCFLLCSGSSGIGKGFAQECQRLGSKVIIWDVHRPSQIAGRVRLAVNELVFGFQLLRFVMADVAPNAFRKHSLLWMRRLGPRSDKEICKKCLG